MQTLTWLFLESTIALGALIALTLFGLLVHWRRGGRARPLLIGMGVGAALLLIQALVVTQREHAAATFARIERGLLLSQVDPIERELASEFRAGEMDTEAFLQRARRTLERVEVLRMRRISLVVHDAQRDRFVVTTRYVCDVRTSNFVGPFESTWRVGFRRDGRGYRIETVDPVYIHGMNVRSWRQLGW